MPKITTNNGLSSSSTMDTANIKCPYFMEHSNYVIKCEGLVPDTTNIMSFAHAEDKKAQQHTFCEGCWERCEVARAIRAFNYLGEDDDK